MVIEKTLPILRVLVFKLKLVNKKLKENVDDFSNLFFLIFSRELDMDFGMQWVQGWGWDSENHFEI